MPPATAFVQYVYVVEQLLFIVAEDELSTQLYERIGKYFFHTIGTGGIYLLAFLIRFGEGHR